MVSHFTRLGWGLGIVAEVARGAGRAVSGGGRTGHGHGGGGDMRARVGEGHRDDEEETHYLVLHPMVTRCGAIIPTMPGGRAH